MTLKAEATIELAESPVLRKIVHDDMDAFYASVRPDKCATILVDREEMATQIGEVDRVPSAVGVADTSPPVVNELLTEVADVRGADRTLCDNVTGFQNHSTAFED
jgi:hypothetical protein